MELKDNALNGALHVNPAVENPLHGVESDNEAFNVFSCSKEIMNPLHGVERMFLVKYVDGDLRQANPLHGVESKCKRAGLFVVCSDWESVTWS